jgi:hypothetical protein
MSVFNTDHRPCHGCSRGIEDHTAYDAFHRGLGLKVGQGCRKNKKDQQSVLQLSPRRGDGATRREPETIEHVLSTSGLSVPALHDHGIRRVETDRSSARKLSRKTWLSLKK